MEVKKTQDGMKMTLQVTGRVDSNTSQAFSAEFLPECSSWDNLTLDFSQLTYISSAGLRVLLQGVKELKRKKQLLHLTHVSEEVKEVFLMTGFDELMDIQSD